MVPFLLLRAPTHHRFTFDLRFLFEMKHKVDLFKSVCRIFHFRFLCFIFIIIYVFDQQKTWKGTHSFAFKSSIFKLQKEVFSSIWVFFHVHSRFTGQQGKGEALCLTPLYHFHPFHRHLDISRAITAESSPPHT